MKLRIVCALIGFLSSSLSLPAQTASAPSVPPLIQFSNIATDEGGNSMSGAVSITFSLYNSQQGSEPLWTETHHNVQLDPTGHYSVQLGITQPNGVPAALFTTGEARWLGVQLAEQPEQPRVLLLSVPYALKAGDAATIGGLPPSAFVLAAPGAAPGASLPATFVAAPADAPPATTVTGSGSANYIPLWTTTSNIADSVLFQTGTGSTANIGINTTTPANTLDVNGTATIRGTLTLPAKGTATATAGFNSRALTLAASAFNSSTGAAANQTFQWLAQPVGNDSSSPSGTLNLLFAEGNSSAAQTGFHIASNGQVTFATGQTFPGMGTVTSVGSGLGLTGGPITTSGTLTIDTMVVPQLAAANTFTGNQIVNGNLTATNLTATATVTGTTVTAAVVNATTSFDLGSNIFAFGSYASRNAFLGFAGNSTTTGVYNLGTGYGALAANTAGVENTAVAGFGALAANTTGNYNTAVGFETLYMNTTGYYNTALGFAALNLNTTGTDNTALGVAALELNTTGIQSVAIGESALADNSTGGGNTATGFRAMFENTTGASNVATGYDALYSNSTATGNTATGAYALNLNTTGAYNTATGFYTLGLPGLGSNNTANGAYALSDICNTCSEDTGVGTYALEFATGSDLTCVGYSCTASAPNIHNATAIGARASVSVSDAVVLGSVAGVNGATATARVGIGTTKPTNLLTLGQGLGPSIADGWTTYSSRRWKTNIQPLRNALTKVEQLRGVSYDLKDSGKHEIGVIAEDVGAVVPEVVTYEDNGKDARGVDYTRLTALLIEATKEQQAEISNEQAQLAKAMSQIKQQQSQLRTQSAAMRSLQAEVREARETLRKVKAQVAAAHPALVAKK
jgi:hypothetical protein